MMKMVRRIIVWMLTNFERIHEIAGPIRNAIPNEAPMKPIFFTRSTGLDISEIYAPITPKPAHPSHPTKRASKYTRKIGVTH